MRILLSTGSAASVSQSSNAPWRLLAGLHDGVLSARSLVLHEHLSAAVDWIERARLAGGDGGISKGFDLLRRRWAPSYPETTGYTVPTLLNAALVLDRPALRALALSLADYLLGNLTPEGGVGHWTGSDSGPIVFDTGQVIFGWIAAYDAIGDDRYLRAAVRAGDWLVAVQDPSGSWKDHQHLGVYLVGSGGLTAHAEGVCGAVPGPQARGAVGVCASRGIPGTCVGGAGRAVIDDDVREGTTGDTGYKETE